MKIFSICHRCRWHRWCTLSCEYLRKFSKKFEMALMVYSGAGGGGTDSWKKKPEAKISWHCLFNFLLHASYDVHFTLYSGGHKKMSSTLLTDSALVHEPKWGGGGGCGCVVSAIGLSQCEYSCAHGAQLNFGDLTPYLTYDPNHLLCLCILYTFYFHLL